MPRLHLRLLHSLRPMQRLLLLLLLLLHTLQPMPRLRPKA
jgi:hypothetical protein